MKRLGSFALLVVACSGSPSPSPPPSAAMLLAKAAELEPALVALRRDIHAHPEVSGEEARTAAAIAERLRGLGLEVRTDIGGHGVVGVLRGAKPGPVLAYRAELDAMPGEEPPGRVYGSTIPGAYHVCGHDVHMAIAVGIATLFASVREQLPGSLIFVFQPAEETWQGADRLLDAGVFEDGLPDEIYALHSFPFQVGTLARDVSFAGLDRFRVELLGDAATDEIAERVIDRLSELGTVRPPRTKAQVQTYLADLQLSDGPLARAVYTDIERDDAAPGRIRGVLKAYSDAAYAELRTRVRELLDAEIGPGTYELSYGEEPLPSMVSDPRITAEASLALTEVVGEDNVLTLRAQHAFSGEDFARFLQQIPGAMFLLGVGNEERGILGAPHFPDFDADEGAIRVGTQAMSVMLLRRMSR
jgi:metal-dependent amidase/aminoacylase/carboxypeptidase family protein